MKSVLVTTCTVGLLFATNVPAQSEDPAAAADTVAENVLSTSLSVRAVAASAVEDREPLGEASSFGDSIERVYLWTLVTGADDSTSITHVWYRDTSLVQSIELAVKADPWRTWSYKTITADLVGDWRVEVLGPQGEPLSEVTFSINSTPASDSPSDQ